MPLPNDLAVDAAPAGSGVLRRVVRGTGWSLFAVVMLLEVLAMGDAGLGKFQNLDGWLYWFARFGYPPQMSLVVGALKAVLTTETDLGWFDPTLHLVFLTIIGTVHWKPRWRPARAAEMPTS